MSSDVEALPFKKIDIRGTSKDGDNYIVFLKNNMRVKVSKETMEKIKTDAPTMETIHKKAVHATE